jgi:hypothetical protein
MKLTEENRSTRGKTCPSTSLSTTNSTCTQLGSNRGLRGDRRTTNGLSHGTAFIYFTLLYFTLSAAISHVFFPTSFPTDKTKQTRLR